MRSRLIAAVTALIAHATLTAAVAAQAPGAVPAASAARSVAPAQSASAAHAAQVRVVLFYSPTCPHCHVVMEQDLPPILERFGDRLLLVSVNAATEQGGRLYLDVAQHYGLSRDRMGVPALVIGDSVLVGSQEIPELLPGLVERAIAAGGGAWPQVPSLLTALERSGVLQQAADAAAREGAAAAPSSPPSGDAPATNTASEAPAAPPAASPDSASAAPAATPGEPATAADRADSLAAAPGGAAAQLIDITGDAPGLTLAQRLARDPAGNGVAVVVLIGLLLVLGWSAAHLRRGGAAGAVPPLLVPILALAGMAVAGYLAFVEITGTTAVCGPVGDCNTVQQSPQAMLFGVLPVGVLGVIGYAALVPVWALQHLGPARLREIAALLLWLGAFVGTLFSAYLTFLEPFVIGASCAWCLTSAAVMAVILMAATPAAAAARSARARPQRRARDAYST